MREADRLIVIRASAGSGKTYALSNRYLDLLRLGVDPAHILATTFTRKAAGEILGRVLTRLGEAARDEEAAKQFGEALDDARLSRRAALEMLGGLVRSMHRVGVSTIDAQMHRMAMCYRHELGLPAAPRLVDSGGPVAAQLRRRAIDAMLADDPPDVLIHMLRRLQHDLAQRRISDALDEIFDPLYDLYREAPAGAWEAIPLPPTLEREQVEDAIAVLRSAGAWLPADKRWHKAWAGDVDRAALRDWQGLVGNGLAKLALTEEPTYYGKPLPDALLQAYRPIVFHAQAVVIRQVLESTAATRDLLRRFDAHYTRLRREHGVVLFGDLPVMLGGVIGQADADPAGGGLDLDPLYFRLDTSVGHLLLDEFQDTSPIQWRVLRPFAQEIRSAAEEDRTFFCVGDVKQAIYGWRGACAAIFDRVIEDLRLPGESLRTLNKSWRSSPAVLDAVNRVFGGIAGCPALAELATHAQRWGEGFETHSAARDGLSGYVTLRATPSPGEDEDARARHLEAVADRVAELAANHPARTLGLLVARNKTSARLLRLLRDRGVDASGEGGAAPDSDPAVELVLSALTLADHPGHLAAAFHVAHSPLGRALGLRESSDESAARVARRVRQQLLDVGYAELITRWAKALAPALGPRSVERVSQLIDLAEQHQPLRPLRAREFVAFVRSTRVEDPTPARVRVMTVHRSKGLEFDIVVLGELSRTIGSVNELVWRHRPDPTGPPAVIVRHANKDLRPTLMAYHDGIANAYDDEVARRVDDDLSALYVAMTRAKRALHLMVEPLKPGKDGKVSRAQLHRPTPAVVLRHALAQGQASEPEGVWFELGDAAWDTDNAAIGPTPQAEPPRPKLTGAAGRARWWRAIRPSSSEGGGQVAAALLFDLNARRSRDFGTRIHRQLEAIESIDTHDAPIDDELRPMLEHDAVRAALSPRYADQTLWRERGFAVRVGGDLIRGVFDRVAIALDESGKPNAATLTDFKTDAYHGEAVERYRPQLLLYRKALAQMLNLEPAAITAELLFVRDGVCVSI